MVKKVNKGCIIPACMLICFAFTIYLGVHLSQSTTKLDEESIRRYLKMGVKRTDTVVLQKRKAIVVFASMRTGSSFFGEYFNQNPQIYYLYDPLQGAGWGEKGASLRQSILWDLLHCNYLRIPNVYADMSKDSWKHCRTGVCFPDRSSFLWRNTKLCKPKNPSCNDWLDPRILEKVCRQSLLTTVKEIAMAKLSELEPILADPALDVKVIQLVRDPRPVVPSRLKMFGATTFERAPEIAKNVCSHYAQNILYTKQCMLGELNVVDKSASCNQTVRDHWKGRFIRVSHEFLSEDPIRALEMLYDFLELNYDANVAAWIRENTNRKPRNVSDQSDLSNRQYSRTRDSKAVLAAWRTRETFENIDKIQKTCASVMDELGYMKVKNEKELRDLSLPTYDSKKLLVLPS